MLPLIVGVDNDMEADEKPANEKTSTSPNTKKLKSVPTIACCIIILENIIFQKDHQLVASLL